MHARSAISDAELNPFLRHTLLRVARNDDQKPLIAVVIIRSSEVLRSVAEEDKLVGRLSL